MYVTFVVGFMIQK
jgi:superoxide reductase